ncbi:MAG: RNA polymerase sporulation sigma factor SigK [Clostridiales bacterium]|jgi:RNA polymerase sporulation-specific sigma factor|nr:RNA polymerase sporulation sigma factor SigK [Clostridiales bacterium]
MFSAMIAAISSLCSHIFALLGYIASSNSFPTPLKPAEEAEYLEKSRNGDMMARNKLIEHNLRLVAYVAKKYHSLKIDKDDLISIGIIGLIKGVESYKGEKGTKLATYVVRCIDNEILMAIRSNKKGQNDMSLDEPIGYDPEGKKITLNDVLSDGKGDIIDEVEVRVEIANLRKLMEKCLDKREQAVLNMHYGMDGSGTEMTQKQIAKNLGISRSYISRIETKAINKLKAARFKQR